MELPHYIITLIHGTWAPSASWTNSDSEIVRHLKDRLPGKVDFETLEWSGKNTVSARSDAVELLVSHLDRQNREHASAHQFILAHSHGGNIALAAVARQGKSAVRGVACMSTPFLHVRDRDIGEHSKFILGFGVFLFILIVISITVATVPHLLWPTHLIPLLVIAVIVMGLTVAVFRLGKKRAKSAAYNVKKQAQYAVSPSINLLILRSPGDEASAAIGAAQIINQAFGFVAHASSRRAGRILDVYNAWADAKPMLRDPHNGIWLIVLGMVVGVAGLYLTQAGELVLSYVSFILAGALLLSGLAVCLPALVVGLIVYCAALLVIPILGIWSIVSLAVGPELLWASAHLEVTAEASPLGKWDVHLIAPRPVGRESLLHSSIYQEPAAMSTISEWIQGCT